MLWSKGKHNSALKQCQHFFYTFRGTIVVIEAVPSKGYTYSYLFDSTAPLTNCCTPKGNIFFSSSISFSTVLNKSSGKKPKATYLVIEVYLQEPWNKWQHYISTTSSQSTLFFKVYSRPYTKDTCQQEFPYRPWPTFIWHLWPIISRIPLEGNWNMYTFEHSQCLLYRFHTCVILPGGGTADLGPVALASQTW